MKTTLLNIKGTWREVADAARTTIGKEAGQGEPASSWKRRILLAEHSPIRKLVISWKWTNLMWWVQTHFTRHKFGVEWFVKTSRSDRTGVDRANLTHSSLVDVEGEANAQAIINISRKRLCTNASKETREAWTTFLNAIKDKEAELFAVCVPDCIYRGHCYEYNSCGYHHTEAYTKKLAKYRKEINGYPGVEYNVIQNLVAIIQRLEREGVDLVVDDIKTVWKAKTILGYSHPDSIEEGTGTLVKKEV